MVFRFLRLLPLALLFAACSHGHALDGAWNEELAGGKKGISIEFDVKGAACMVHKAPPADGSHPDHIDGVTYTFDAATKTVTVKGKLMGDGKADTWTGKLDGKKLELASADGKLQLVHGDGGHGH